MVKKILSFVNKEIGGLHEAAYLLALSSVASLIFALVRDRLLAHLLGPGPTLDVYYAAFRVPDFIFISVASLVSTSILVPFLIESRQKGEGDLKACIQSLFTSFSILILVVSALAYIFMEPLQRLLFPNLFTGGLGDDLVSTSRILLLSPILLGFGSFFTSITQIHNRFIAYAIASPLYNIGIIIGIIAFLPSFGIGGLAMGVVLGALLMALSQVPMVAKDGLFPKLSLKFEWARVWKVAKLAVPRTITLSSQQVTMLGLVSFASFLGAGSISIFNLASNLQSVPLSIIGVSYASAAFPVLAKLMSEGNREAFLDKMISAAKHIIFWSVPLSALFIVLRAQIVRTVLGSGEFTWSDTKLTAAALALFILSVVGQSLMLLFVRSFYAEGKTAKPLIINAVCAVATLGIGYVLLKVYFASAMFRYFVEALLRTEGGSDSSVLMLPLAFSIGTALNLVLHWRAFSKDFPGFTYPVMRTAFQTLSASIIGSYVAYRALHYFDGIFDINTTVGVFLQGLCAGVIGMLIIGLILYLLKSKEFVDIKEAFKKRVWKVDEASLDKLPS
jgi:putative peptidoglycan lipid II flippase